MEEERILAVAPQFNLDGITRTVGDLVFTNRRVFLAKTADNVDVAQAFGVVGALAAALSSSATSKQLQAQPLEAILPAADRRVFFEYGELEAIIVKRGWFFSSTVKVKLTPRHGKRVMLWGRGKATSRLISALPSLTSAGVPISVS